LSGNLETTLPFETDEFKDTDYQPKRDAAQELVGYRKKSQRELDKFRRFDYSLSLRETPPLNHKGSRSELSREPKFREIVIVKGKFFSTQDVENGLN